MYLFKYQIDCVPKLLLKKNQGVYRTASIAYQAHTLFTALNMQVIAMLFDNAISNLNQERVS
jgi:hypothetical protein